MTTGQIVGISGLAGSGKDTVALILKGNHRYTTVSFADPLKRICRDVYAFSVNQLWGPSEMRNAPDLRYPRQHSFPENPPDARPGDEIACPCCGQETTLHRVEDELLVPDLEEITPCHLTPRYALQMLGTEWGRNCYPDTWAAMAIRTAHTLFDDSRARYNQQKGLFTFSGLREGDPPELHHPVTSVSIPDVRFLSEMSAIRRAGGKIIRVKRPSAGLKGATGRHQSETEQMALKDTAFDYVIENDGSLDELQDKVYEIFLRLSSTSFQS